MFQSYHQSKYPIVAHCPYKENNTLSIHLNVSLNNTFSDINRDYKHFFAVRLTALISVYLSYFARTSEFCHFALNT